MNYLLRRYARTLGFAFVNLCLVAASAHAAVRQEQILQIGLVSPTILSLTIVDGTFIRDGQEPYIAQPNDEVRIPNADYKPSNTPQLWRNGEFKGWLVNQRRTLTKPDRVVGSLPEREWLNDRQSFQIQSDADPRFMQSAAPARISRKSMPNSTTRGIAGVENSYQAVVHHTIYLQLDQPWKQGTRYRISFAKSIAPIEFTLSELTESEAIHASQIGFTPEDQSKIAFMSVWLGTGGAMTQKDKTPFYVVNAQGTKIYSGEGRITKRANDNESTATEPRNLNLTDVVMFDFSSIKERGQYRIVVPGVGASAPIMIADTVWLNAFKTVMQYFYVQRSGIEIRPPYSGGYRRPRNYHPEDGVKITQSTATLMDNFNGLRVLPGDAGNFPGLIAGDTGKVLAKDAWGGYHDSGDWDRRIQHLNGTRAQLDLLLDGGAYFKDLNLNIPESGNGLPDLLNEALWNLDFYRKLMTPEGGVRGGIEQAEHPNTGETSWVDSFPSYAYAPDAWSSYLFAACAARAATYAERKYPVVARTYREAALKAMVWAETELQRLPKEYLEKIRTQGGYLPNETAGQALGRARHLAAADIYRMSGDARWQLLFTETWEYKTSESLYVYLRTAHKRDAATVKRSRAALLDIANTVYADQQQLAFRWTRPFVGAEYRTWGLFTFLDGADALARAYEITGDVKYRNGVIQATQMLSGANPNNRTYISGLGHNPMRNISHIDSYTQGLEAPPGFVAFGAMNPNTPRTIYHVQIKRVENLFVPTYREWPQTEMAVDSNTVHPVVEHLPDMNARVAYYFGTLARSSKSKPPVISSKSK
jgi:endoglucanase